MIIHEKAGNTVCAVSAPDITTVAGFAKQIGTENNSVSLNSPQFKKTLLIPDSDEENKR
jgi:hypothetical protein